MSSDAHYSASRRDPAYKWKVISAVMVGTFMAALNASIVNVSTPDIMASFGVSLDDIKWVVTSYMIGFAVLMPLTSFLRGRMGHTRLFTWSLVVFLAGSLLCGMAWNFPVLIFARILQALGGGAMTPTGMSLINDVFPAQDKGRGLGYFSMGVIVAPAIGPTLGGYLTQVFGWRSIFFVNLPFGIAAIVLSLVFLKSDVPHKDTHRPFDFWGFFFLSLFMVAFLLGVSNGQHEGWSSHYVFTCWILSIVGFACFLLVEKQMKDRVVELDLFKNSVFTICFLVSAVRSVALFGSIFLLPLFLQNLMGFDEITTGLILLPGSVLMAALMVPSGKLGDRIGPRLLAIFGVLILAYFMWMYRTLDVDTSTWNVILPMLVRGFGIALLMNPIMAAALNAVPRRLAGQASSLLSLSQQVAGSIGIAILSTVMTNRTLYHLNVLGSGMDASSSVMGHSIALLRQYALDMGYSHQAAVQVANALALRNASRAAQVRGFDDAFLCGMIIIATALIPAFFLPGKPVHQVPMDPAEIVAAE